MPKEINSDRQRYKITVDDLLGKQSVRATFRLPRQVIDLLSIVAKQLGIKQKTLFDQLVDNPDVLGRLAEEALDNPPEQQERRQKTYVISRSSLGALDVVARQRRISRDVLVEISIKRLLPVIDNEIDKHNKRKELLAEMEMNLKQGRILLDRAAKLLGVDDQVYGIIKHQVKISEKNVTAVRDMVDKGKPMEEW